MKKKTEKEFVYEGFGFPVVLHNVPMVEVRGEWSPLIDLNKLMEVVLITLCHQMSPFTGGQIAFIRHYFEMTGETFGKKFGVTQACVSKWEARGDESAKMEPATEFCMKLFVLESLHEEVERTVRELLFERDLKRESKIHELKPDPIFLEEEELKACLYA